LSALVVRDVAKLVGTTAANQPFLPLLLPAGTTAVAVLYVVLAGVAGAVARPRALSTWSTLALPAIPAVVLAGLGTFLGIGVSDDVNGFAGLPALPLAMVDGGSRRAGSDSPGAARPGRARPYPLSTNEGPRTTVTGWRVGWNNRPFGYHDYIA
jgi:hypothetical protein